jgi:putative phosphoesterase
MTSAAMKALDSQPEVHHVFYLGDGAKQIEGLKEYYPDKKFYIVNGNCDFGSDFSLNGAENINGTRIFYTHGHNLGVKYGTERLLETAKTVGAKIALYGHTHMAKIEYIDDIYVINPGALSHSRCGYCSYAVVDILCDGIMPIIIKC